MDMIEFLNQKIHLLKELPLVDFEALTRRNFFKMLKAVQFMHKYHIAHRDIKLENTLVNLAKRDLVVSDLGFSTFIPLDDKIVLEGRTGTECYMAPELFTKMANPFKGDIYALGISLYMMSFISKPYSKYGDRYYQFFSKGDYKAILGKNSDLYKKRSPELIALIESLTNVDPSKRPSIEEILANAWVTGSEPSQETLDVIFK
jgi:serine/threonine protein kinase